MLAAGDHVRAVVCPCRPLNVKTRMLDPEVNGEFVQPI